MAESKLMNLRICDDVRDGSRGPLLGRTLYNADADDIFFIAVPFSETKPQAFSTRWHAREYVERRGKPVPQTGADDANANANANANAGADAESARTA